MSEIKTEPDIDEKRNSIRTDIVHRIGIQGCKGSFNEKATYIYTNKKGWHEDKDFEIKYFVLTKAIFEALDKGEIEYGVFPYKTQEGLVGESKKAIETIFKSHKNFREAHDIEGVKLDIVYALLSKKGACINEATPINVYSHEEALKETLKFIREKNYKAIKANGIASAAKKLANGEYPENSLALSSTQCIEHYEVEIYNNNIPTDKPAWTMFHVVKKKKTI